MQDQITSWQFSCFRTIIEIYFAPSAGFFFFLELNLYINSLPRGQTIDPLTHRVLPDGAHVGAVAHRERLSHARIRTGAHLEEVLRIKERTQRI